MGLHLDRGLRPFAPFIFVLLQASQIVLAPIPGQLIAFVGGYLFGVVQGTIYSLIGAVLGRQSYFSLPVSTAVLRRASNPC